MLNVWKTTARALAVVALAGAGLAQEVEASKFYKLDFVVKEVEGARVVNARAYSTIILIGKSVPPTAIRTGSKVPFQASPGSVSYADVGVDIDCSDARETAGQLALSVTADISSVPQESSGSAPIVRQNKWTSVVIVPIRKPTVLFSSDDPTSKRQMQVELTATPIR